MTLNRSLSPGTSRSRLFSGFLRVLTFSLITVAFALRPLHAQTVAYVANNNSNSVSVIDVPSNTVTATIPVGLAPIGIAFSPDGATAYVTNENGGTISVINTATNSITATIGPLTGPAGAVGPKFPAITPDGNTLYVPANGGVATVQVVSTATNTVTDVITLAQFFAGAAAVTPDGKRVYVLTDDFAPQLNVVVIDTATNTQVGPSVVVSGNQTGPGIAITPSGGTVCAAGGTAPVVTAMSTANNTVITTIPTADFPLGIAITPDGTRAYVSDLNAGAVTVIDTASNTAVANISPFSQPFGVAITPDGASVFITNENTASVSVIDTATNTVVATVPVGSNPLGVAIANLNAPFAAFTIDNLNISPQGFHEQGDFTLGANSQGIDLAHQLVKLTIGSFSLTIPAGSFLQVSGNHHFELNAIINGLQVNFSLKANHGSNTAFSYTVNVNGVDLTSQPDPVTVGLQIANNTGTTTRQF
ncbi:MAG TPA: cytochrome D1 domain-containing protein [Candidatus Angelobacter sp.]|nr:cytochrome D1 domain-containing protein [Candidatus Angelobacter sp.]